MNSKIEITKSFDKKTKIWSLNVDRGEYHYSRYTKDKKINEELFKAFTSIKEIIELENKNGDD